MIIMIFKIMQYLYDKFKAYHKLLVIVFLGLLLSFKSHVIFQFDKDLIKLSKLKGDNIFYDNKKNTHSINQITDKKNIS